MHLFFRFFSLAAAAVVIVDSLLAGGAKFSAAQFEQLKELAPRDGLEPIVSPDG